jgi:hypothetical protein
VPTRPSCRRTRVIRRAEPATFHHVAFSLDSWHEVGSFISEPEYPTDRAESGGMEWDDAV